MNSGKKAEQVAAEWLSECGWMVIDRNRVLGRVEVDIIVEKKRSLFFGRKSYCLVEVKYRKVTDQGSAAEYITGAKIDRLKRAHTLFSRQVSERDQVNIGYVALEGKDFAVAESNLELFFDKAV